MTRRGAREGRTAPASRSVYFFGGGRAQGTAAMRDLGGKGANLAEMTRLGVPVPPGFTIVTHVAQAFASAGGRLPDAVLAQARRALSRVERIAGARFGDPDRPLLVSVRSGGCRLGITFPEIYRMQARAIAGAAREVAEAGGAIRPEIMKGRRARPELKLGLCGEHGGDPKSVRFCARAGLDYVSCSPFRVPIARLAAAQTALADRA
jgi:phosphoenolpyruvate synthase/pyruvate phosphate dikinase